MTEKAIGYSLLASGVLLILVALVYIFLVFTGRTAPIDLFSFDSVSLDPAAMMSSSLPPGVTLDTSSAPKQEIISGDMLSETSNLFATLFLMGFVAGIGQKLASIGVMLLRPIEVKIKAKDQ